MDRPSSSDFDLKFVRVADHPQRGKILVATQALYAGQTILHEAPLILAPGGRNPYRVRQAVAASPQAVQDEILTLWSPVHGQKAEGFRQELSSLHPELPHEDKEVWVKLFMAFSMNAFAVRADDTGTMVVGLYKIAGRASHSCHPNCFWFTDKDDRKVMRTVVTVEAGEELTIDYMSDGFVMKPVHERQAEMMARREFLCQCPRCSAHGDDTRRICCSAAHCPGHHLVHQPTSSDNPELTACSSCRALPSAAAAACMLAQEAEMLKELDKLDTSMAGAIPGADAFPTLTRLKPPHRHHAAAARLGLHQWRLFGMFRLWEPAAAALEAVIECRNAILPGSADYCCSLAQALLSCERVGVQHVLRAQLAYRKALQAFVLRRGPSAPSCTSLASDLAAAQARLPAEQVAALATLEACSLCGSPGYGGTALAKCGRCRAAAYCCREHQQAQWPLHKKHCQPAPL